MMKTVKLKWRNLAYLVVICIFFISVKVLWHKNSNEARLLERYPQLKLYKNSHGHRIQRDTLALELATEAPEVNILDFKGADTESKKAANECTWNTTGKPFKQYNSAIISTSGCTKSSRERFLEMMFIKHI